MPSIKSSFQVIHTRTAANRCTNSKIQQLDHTLLVVPGHYISWSEAGDDLVFAAPLAEAIDNEADFPAFIKRNIRWQPEAYATIRKINANLEQVEDEKAEELDLGKNECAASAYAAQQGTT